jgi:hypothetical protein
MEFVAHVDELLQASLSLESLADGPAGLQPLSDGENSTLEMCGLCNGNHTLSVMHASDTSQ